MDRQGQSVFRRTLSPVIIMTYISRLMARYSFDISVDKDKLHRSILVVLQLVTAERRMMSWGMPLVVYICTKETFLVTGL